MPDSTAPVVAGLIAGIAFIVIFALFAPAKSAGSLVNQGIVLITTADAKCAQYGEWASIADEGGFAAIKPFGNAPPLKAGVETPDRKPGLYEFVLALNSTGYIKMVYDSCNQQTIGIGNASEFFESFDTRKDGMYRFDDDERSEGYQTGQAIWLPSNDTGIAVYPSDVKQETKDRFVVTYTLEAGPDALEGLYILNLYHTCPGQLLTIGDKPHQSKIPWANGGFFGCGF